MATFVYAMRREDGLVKIGRSTNLSQRALDVRRALHGSPVEVIWSIEANAYLEWQLHGEFAERWVSGEWFDFGDVDPVPLISAAAERFRSNRQSPLLDRDDLLAALRKVKKTRQPGAYLPKDLILAALNADMGVMEIANEIGCSTTSVKNLRRATSVRPTPFLHQPPEADENNIGPDPRYAHLRPPVPGKKENTP